jgi:hypothetical protein
MLVMEYDFTFNFNEFNELLFFLRKIKINLNFKNWKLKSVKFSIKILTEK